MIYKCKWSQSSIPENEKYHDEEWCVPVNDDRIHFEFLILEAAQAGLSWSTIVKRRGGYRKAFANFDPSEVAMFDENKIQKLLQDPGIIRNQLKIRAAVNNAQKFLEIQKEFGSFDKYVWQFVDNQTINHKCKSSVEIPATTKESDKLSKDLKKRGFKFVGSTIMYAYMQACGLVNDHEVECFRYKEIAG